MFPMMSESKPFPWRYVYFFAVKAKFYIKIQLLLWGLN